MIWKVGVLWYLVLTTAAVSVTLEPLGWSQGEGQVYFLEYPDEHSVGQPVLLYLFQLSSGVMISLPLRELAVPFCWAVASGLPDRESPGQPWIDAARKKLTPLVSLTGKAGTAHLSKITSRLPRLMQVKRQLIIPGGVRTFVIGRTTLAEGEEGDRLLVFPSPRASAVAMADQIYTVELASASRPGLLSKMAEWVTQAGYLPYLLRTQAQSYSLRTGCFVGKDLASSHAKQLSKTLGLAGVKVTNQHEVFQNTPTLESVSLMTTSWKGERDQASSMTSRWWFWAGLAILFFAGGAAVVAYLRLGADHDEPPVPPVPPLVS